MDIGLGAGRVARGAAVIGFAATLWATSPARGAIVIDRWTVDSGGGGLVASRTYVLGGTAGQADAGRLAGGAMALWGGFWPPGSFAPVGVPSDPPAADPAAPAVSWIRPAAPNPAVRGIRIEFALAAEGPVDIRVFDVGGALLRTIESGTLAAGAHARHWDVADDGGRRVPAGVYLVRVLLPGLDRTQKVVVLR